MNLFFARSARLAAPGKALATVLMQARHLPLPPVEFPYNVTMYKVCDAR